MGATGLHVVFAMFFLFSSSLFMASNALFLEDILNFFNLENEVEDESQFSYESGTEKGPEHWGRLNPTWHKCETGHFQSPVDLLDSRVQMSNFLGELIRAYKPAPAVVKNRGHDIMVQWTGDAGYLDLNGTHYNLLQCHWHTPSEHLIDGRSFNMELHMVHNSSKGQIAVVSIMYDLGNPDKFVDKLLPHLNSSLSEEGNSLGVVSPWQIRFGSRKYFSYIGSLTVPPCTEGVAWIVLKKVRTTSPEQLAALRNAVHDGYSNNARPAQNLNGRSVNVYHPEL